MPDPSQDSTGASAPFDFEAFISGAQLARGKVSFYLVDHSAEIEALRATKAPADERESGGKDPSRLAELEAAMQASFREVEIRDLTPDEFKAVREDGSETAVYDQLALQSVNPPLTAKQWHATGEVIGFAQFKQVVDAATALVLSKVAVPDFSQNASTTRSRRPSSQS
jgi:hypothetical protein